MYFVFGHINSQIIKQRTVKMSTRKQRLIVTDLEPDDKAVLLWYAREGVRCDVVVGHGDVKVKMQWMQAFMESVPELTQGWRVFPGVSTPFDPDDTFPAPPETKETVECGEFDPKQFEDLVRSHTVVISIKPHLEFLTLPAGVTFPDQRLYATMSFNLRATVEVTHGKNAPLDAITQNAKRIIEMFPNFFAWIESFPALGQSGKNTGSFTFKNPVIRSLQLQWNTTLLRDSLQRIKKKAAQLGYAEDIELETLNEELKAKESSLTDEQEIRLVAGLLRTIKACLQIKSEVETNNLIVDPLVVAIETRPDLFPLTPVEYKGHNVQGYPVLEKVESANLYMFQGDPETTGPLLAKYVTDKMLEM